MNSRRDGPADDVQIIRLRHPWRKAIAVVIILLAIAFLVQMFLNPRYRWDLVTSYMLHPLVLKGLANTLALTVIAMLIGIALGTVIAVMYMSPNFMVRYTAGSFIWLFRGTPTLVLIIFWYNLAALYPYFAYWTPWDGVQYIHFNKMINPYSAAIIALGLHEAAYMAEIVRGGILSVDSGQSEAARALGMRPTLTLRRIIIPQAMKSILPPTGNQVISMLKATSLVSVIAMGELLHSVTAIYSTNFQVIPLLVVATIWYLICTSILTWVQSKIERRFA